MIPFNNLRWYKQDTGRGPVSLTVLTNKEDKTSNGRYAASLDEDAKRSTLTITASLLDDTGTYLCVVGAPCSPETYSQYQNLPLEVSRRPRSQRSLLNTLLGN